MKQKLKGSKRGDEGTRPRPTKHFFVVLFCILYHGTSRSQAQALFFWYDYFSCPQLERRHGFGADDEDSSKQAHAINSIPAYVTNCHFFLALCPVIDCFEENKVLSPLTWRRFHANYVLATCLASVEAGWASMWSLTAKVCQGLSFSSDALLDSMDLFLQSRGDVHALQWLSILLILAHVELVTGELLTIVEKPVSSSSHEGDWARTARSHLISGTSLRQDLAALAGDVAKWTSATGQVSETALIRMDFRASRAPLLQESSAGDGPYVGSPASHAYSWGDFILKRRCGYVAQRVGEASHPGPGGRRHSSVSRWKHSCMEFWARAGPFVCSSCSSLC